jgi:hypothetical protein
MLVVQTVSVMSARRQPQQLVDHAVPSLRPTPVPKLPSPIPLLPPPPDEGSSTLSSSCSSLSKPRRRKSACGKAIMRCYPAMPNPPYRNGHQHCNLCHTVSVRRCRRHRASSSSADVPSRSCAVRLPTWTAAMSAVAGLPATYRHLRLLRRSANVSSAAGHASSAFSLSQKSWHRPPRRHSGHDEERWTVICIVTSIRHMCAASSTLHGKRLPDLQLRKRRQRRQGCDAVV